MLVTLGERDADVRQAALELLSRVVEVVRRDDKNPRGLLTRAEKKSGLLLGLARLVVGELQIVFKKAKAEGKADAKLYADAAWVAAKVAEANKVLATKSVPPLPARCTPRHVKDLQFEAPKDVALTVLHAANPGVSMDDLRRKVPLVRRKKRL